MTKRIMKQVRFPEKIPTRLRVAAYARVSSGKDAMLHSLAAQVSFYAKKIKSNGAWEYVGVYADEAKTGTKDNRQEFQRLLADCKAGKIDHILTKSVSRFARNTVTLLETVRELKELGVSICFEEQNIDTRTTDGEFLLSILASFAEAESKSVSDNQKWRVKHQFKNGKPWRYFMLGYRNIDGVMTIVPEEARIVRRIYDEYLAGDGLTKISNRLNEEGISTQAGYAFHRYPLYKILTNYAYTGNLLLQTKYRENHLTKETRVNQGELPMYHVENSHEAIISLETFQAVQAEMKRRKKKFAPKLKSGQYALSGKIKCEICGKNYRRKITQHNVFWICTTYNSKGKNYCASKAIPESTLEELIKDVGEFESAIAAPHNLVHFHLSDGRVITKEWQDRSRSESWTPTMREKARKKALERKKNE